MSNDTEVKLQQVSQSLNNGNKTKAKRLVDEILEESPDNADAWFMASLVTDMLEQKLSALTLALEINPHHTKANEYLVYLTNENPHMRSQQTNDNGIDGVFNRFLGEGLKFIGKFLRLESSPTHTTLSETQSIAAPVIKPENTNDTKSTASVASVHKVSIDSKKRYVAEFMTTRGNFEIELFTDKAPVTVNNFVFLVRNGFYDGLTFHRVIANFMIQGGDPTGTGRGGPGYKWNDEKSALALPHETGVLSMANAGPNTNGSQFFITHSPQPHLNGKHAVFGKIMGDGMTVVNAIKQGDVMKKVTIKESSPTHTTLSETQSIAAPVIKPENTDDTKSTASVASIQQTNSLQAPPQERNDKIMRFSGDGNKGNFVTEVFDLEVGVYKVKYQFKKRVEVHIVNVRNGDRKGFLHNSDTGEKTYHLSWSGRYVFEIDDNKSGTAWQFELELLV